MHLCVKGTLNHTHSFTEENEKAPRETQTLHAGCSKVEPNIFAQPQNPFPGVQDGKNLISWRWSLPSPTNPVWWRSMHAISTYRGNRPTNTHTHTRTNPQTGPITIHCTTKLSVKCNDLYRSRASKNQMLLQLYVFISFPYAALIYASQQNMISG